MSYWRASSLKGGVVRTVMSTRVETQEITAAEARATNDAVPGFNNRISRVFQVAANSRPRPTAAPFPAQSDWAEGATACRPPAPP